VYHYYKIPIQIRVLKRTRHNSSVLGVNETSRVYILPVYYYSLYLFSFRSPRSTIVFVCVCVCVSVMCYNNNKGCLIIRRTRYLSTAVKKNEINWRLPQRVGLIKHGTGIYTYTYQYVIYIHTRLARDDDNPVYCNIQSPSRTFAGGRPVDRNLRIIYY